MQSLSKSQWRSFIAEIEPKTCNLFKSDKVAQNNKCNVNKIIPQK